MPGDLPFADAGGVIDMARMLSDAPACSPRLIDAPDYLNSMPARLDSDLARCRLAGLLMPGSNAVVGYRELGRQYCRVTRRGLGRRNAAITLTERSIARRLI